MVVGVCRLTLMVPESHSLKEKRVVLQSIKDRARRKFNVAIAEVGSQDAWQQAVLGFAVVANERAFVETMVDKIVNFIEELALAKIVDDEKDIVPYGDGPLAADEWGHWEPDPKPTIKPLAGGSGGAAGAGSGRSAAKIQFRSSHRGPRK